MLDTLSSPRKCLRSVDKTEEAERIAKEKAKLNDVRRSIRDPSLTLLEKTDFKNLIEKIKINSTETVILKVKNHILSDINSAVIDTIFDTLMKNNVCQALYVQNLSHAFGNDQLYKLIELLKKKQIWCLNIGENYKITNKGWEYFCNSLPSTSVTHLYVSEHVITIDLKNKMRANIRENRKKHDKHCSMKNLRVIEKCTNMWWNPINGVKELRPPPPPPVVEAVVAPQPVYIPLTPAHTAYWQQGVGPGGDVAWKFNCMCGETCSSYENFRYHPVGRMYACCKCEVWSHVSCVLGDRVTEEDLEEMTDIMCNGCRTRTRRELKSSDPDAYAMFMNALQNEAAYKRQATGTSSSGGGGGGSRVRTSTGGSGKASSGARSGSVTPRKKSRTSKVVAEQEEGWKFKCLCGEVCSSYENPRYHPLGKWYECTQCSTWSHVACMYGPRMTDEDMEKIHDALCNSCRTKTRRVRNRNGGGDDDAIVAQLLAATIPTTVDPPASETTESTTVGGHQLKSIHGVDAATEVPTDSTADESKVDQNQPQPVEI